MIRFILVVVLCTLALGQEQGLLFALMNGRGAPQGAQHCAFCGGIQLAPPPPERNLPSQTLSPGGLRPTVSFFWGGALPRSRPRPHECNVVFMGGGGVQHTVQEFVPHWMVVLEMWILAVESSLYREEGFHL